VFAVGVCVRGFVGAYDGSPYSYNVRSHTCIHPLTAHLRAQDKALGVKGFFVKFITRPDIEVDATFPIISVPRVATNYPDITVSD